MITVISASHRFKKGSRPWRYVLGETYYKLERLLIICRRHNAGPYPCYKARLDSVTTLEILDMYLFATRKEAKQALIDEMQERERAYNSEITRCLATVDARQKELKFLHSRLRILIKPQKENKATA